MQLQFANMNPYDEQRLIDEVIYLHSLWHQGPTPPNPIPIPIHNNIASASSEPYIPQPLPPHCHLHLHRHHHHQQHPINPNPIIPFAPAHTRSLPPTISTSTSFKNNNRKKNKKRKRWDPITQPDPGPEWPCPVIPDPPATGWAASKPRSAAPPAPAVSPQEKERLFALQAQNMACQAFRGFLMDSDDDDDDDDDDEVEEIEEFFVGIFMEDDELRGYYQRCFESGEFCCLVCGAIGKKKSGKRYKDCVGLVHHSMSISVKRPAHRAFGQAVCKVLGWDIDRLPTIVMKGEPLGCPVGMKKAEAEGEPKENANDDGDGRDGSHKSDDKVVSLEHGDEQVEEHAQGVVGQSIGECSSKEGGDLDGKMLDFGLENAGDRAIDEGEPKEKVDDDGGDGPHKSDDKVVSLELGDEHVEEHARGVYPSISECSSKEGDVNNSVENLDEKMLDIGLENEGGGAIDGVCKNPNCDSSSTASGWPSFNTKSSSQTCSQSAEAQASGGELQMQHKALKACEGYLVGNAGSGECEEFKFFLRLFTEDSDLRRYYENNYREGDFCCLVCGSIGKKIRKRFKDCIALLQHSTAVKMKKREGAHRAYSQVICKVLGWDNDQLPAIVLKGESLGSSLAGSSKLSGEPEKPADDNNDDSNVLKENQAK